MTTRRQFAHPSTAAAIRTWAAQKRSLYLEEEAPVASILGKIRDERTAAGAGEARRRQHWPEVYTGDGIQVERIVRTLAEYPRLTVTSYYLFAWPWRVPVYEQAGMIGVKVREYWMNLHIAESVIDSGLMLLAGRLESVG